MKTEINNINNEIVKISVKNNKRLNIILCNLGASIRNIFIDDKKISLSPKDDSLFIRNDNYFGKTIGRTAGRIKNGEYILNGKNANLEKNDGNNNLHSGKDGYHQKLFDYEIINDNDYTRVVFKYYSPNLDGGHLGALNLNVIYKIYKNKDVFEINYVIKALDDVFVNLTNHIYLNLSGNFKNNIKNELLYINASMYGKLDKELILKSKEKINDYYNFKDGLIVGKYLNKKEVLENTSGYDNPFILDEINYNNVAAKLIDNDSKLTLNIYTDYKVVHLYTNNFNTDYEIMDNIFDEKNMALCLECEYLPNSINDFEYDAVIKKGNIRTNKIKYEFI